MSYSIYGNEIRLTRGDTFDAKIRIKMHNTKDLYIPRDGDKIFFGLKKRIEDTACLIYKEIPTDTLILHLDPEDTRYLDFGNYWYDVQLNRPDGFVSTFITKSLFRLLEEVCYND